METTRVGALHLSGQNAVSFFHSFFHPTEEERRQFYEIRDSIDREVSIRETEIGFEAEIEGLDLSFLDNHEDEVSIVARISRRKNEGYVFVEDASSIKLSITKKESLYIKDSSIDNVAA